MTKINDIDYLKIIKDAWKLCWKHKFLWILGFLVFVGTLANNFTLNRNSQNSDMRMQIVLDYINQHPIIYFVIATLSFLVFAISLVAQAGLIKAVNDITLYQQLGYRKTLKAGRAYFWNILIINLLTVLAVITTITLVAVPSMLLLSFKAYVLAFMISVLALFIFSFLGLLIFFVRKYSIIYLVLADCKFKEAIKKAYSILIGNPRSSILMLLITFGLYISLAASIILIVLSFIAIAYLVKITISTAATSILLILASFAIIIIMGLLFAFFTAFKEAAWIIFFKIISSTHIEEKIESEAKENVIAIPNPEAV
jgi:hypothetical protein